MRLFSYIETNPFVKIRLQSYGSISTSSVGPEWWLFKLGNKLRYFLHAGQAPTNSMAEIPCTALTVSSQSGQLAPVRQTSSSIPWSDSPSPATSITSPASESTKPYFPDIPTEWLSSDCSLWPCEWEVPAKPSGTPSSARTTAPPTSS